MPSRRIVARELGDMLGVLSHPERILIVQLLATRGQHRVGDIAATLDMPEARTSQHLARLRSQRIVAFERTAGRERHYRLANPAIAWWLVQGVEFVAGRVNEATAVQIHEARRLWTESFDSPEDSMPKH